MKTVMQELIDLMFENKLHSKLDILAQAHILKQKEEHQKEDFAIGFAEFLEGRDLYLEKITIVEAMEIYKKEKGL